MLNNISNFFNLFKTKKIKKTLAPNDIIPIGVRDTTNRADYQASGITYKDFAAQIAPPPTPSTNIYNSDGTLNATRGIDCNNNNVNWNNAGNFSIKNTNGSNQFYLSNGGINFFYGTINNEIGVHSGSYSTGINITLGSIRGTNFRGLITQNIFGVDTNGVYNGPPTWNGLKLDLANKRYELGNLTGGNTTTLKIDDAAGYPVQINGVNVTQNTAGVASGLNLKIKVNGVDYVIELKQPA